MRIYYVLTVVREPQAADERPEPIASAVTPAVEGRMLSGLDRSAALLVGAELLAARIRNERGAELLAAHEAAELADAEFVARELSPRPGTEC